MPQMSLRSCGLYRIAITKVDGFFYVSKEVDSKPRSSTPQDLLVKNLMSNSEMRLGKKV